MKDYFTASEIAAAQGVSVRAVNKAASKGRSHCLTFIDRAPSTPS